MCLQAQCILFRRYPEVLEPFKYAGYPMLLQAVALPLHEQGEGPAAHFLGAEQAPRLQVTLCCSPASYSCQAAKGLSVWHDHQNIRRVSRQRCGALIASSTLIC